MAHDDPSEREAKRQPKRPSSYRDDVNESPSVVHDQPADVEEETPIEGNESIETGQSPDSPEPEPPAFEE